MDRHRSGIVWRSAGRVAATACIALVALSPHAAAVTTVAPTTTLSNAYASSHGVTYTFAGYQVDNGEMATGAQITFPAGTDLTTATLLAPSGTMQVTGQVVTISFSPTLPKGTPIAITIAGIANPPTTGVHSVGSIVFYTGNPNNNQARAPQSHPSATYTLMSHYISLTIVTPDAGQSVLFGDVNPGVTSPVKWIGLTVDSSTSYTLSRAIAGDVSAMGLEVVGDASGFGPAGVTSFGDQMTVSPPWTTDPDITYTAIITYSVVQDPY